MTWNELTVEEGSERFKFRPSVYPYDFPGIKEPAPSVTYSFSGFYGLDKDLSSRLDEDLTLNALSAFRMITRPGEFLLALDWQHECFTFDPHANDMGLSEDDWNIPILPNGDYSIFATRDFSDGIFGHPWEQTVCVFGPSLLGAFDKFRPLLFKDVVRIDGRNVKEFCPQPPPEGTVLKVFISSPGEASDTLISKIFTDLKRAFYEKNRLHAFYRDIWAGNGYVIYIGDKTESAESTKIIALKVLDTIELPRGSGITEIKAG